MEPQVGVTARSWRSWATPWFAAAFIAWPIYVFPSGQPQPVTYALLAALASAAVQDLRGLAAVLANRQVLLLLAFVCYAGIVNAVAALSSQNAEPMVHALYYVQVATGSVVLQYLLHAEPRIRQVIFWSVWIALAVQACALAFMGAGEGRATLFFGNPNQLSLFALLALGYLLLLHPAGRAHVVVTLTGVLIAILLVIVSLSKAAMVAAFFMIALAVVLMPVSGPMLKRLRPAAMILLPIAVASIIILLRDQFALLNAVLDRLSDIGVSADDSLAGRGYLRIVEWPQYLLFGAGEGLTARFSAGFEVHSMFGTLLFSYGLPGLVLVLCLLAASARQALRPFIVVFVPVLLYALSHHPMRQPMVWMLLFLIGAAPQVTRLRAGRTG